MLDFYSKYKLQIFMFLVFILAAVLAAFGIWPSIQTTNSNLKIIQEQKIKIKEADNKKENLEKIKKNTDTLEKIKNKISDSLSSKNVLDFVIKIEDAAKKSNVDQQLQIQEEKPTPTPTPTETPTENGETASRETGEEIVAAKPKETKSPLAFVPHILMSIYLNGEFKNLVSYLIYLENINYQTDIDTLTINLQGTGVEALPENLPTPPEKVSDENKITATLETKIFTNE